jgi:hypothetical protein
MIKGKRVQRVDDVVEAAITRVPGKPWIKIVPAQPLPTGEYAIETPVFEQMDMFPSTIFDFGLAPPAANTPVSVPASPNP